MSMKKDTMTSNPELTIVLPSKNEEENIGRTVESILAQDYPAIRNTRIILADNHSTDRTREVFLSFQDRGLVEVLDGGLPSIARNRGAKSAQSKYILFLDADILLGEPSSIRKAVELAKRKDLDCVTTRLQCRDGNWKDHLLYFMTNRIITCSKCWRPFSTGAFMLFKKETFDQLGGFNERVHFSEDYFLSKQVKPRKFGVAKTFFYTDNRRFKKTGYWKMIRMFLNTAIHSNDPEYFYRDHKYFD